MTTHNCPISACKHCRCFQSEGRRGGVCEQFGTFADPNWPACALAKPAFDEIWTEKSNLVLLENSFNLKSIVDKQHMPVLNAQNSALYTEAV